MLSFTPPTRNSVFSCLFLLRLANHNLSGRGRAACQRSSKGARDPVEAGAGESAGGKEGKGGQQFLACFADLGVESLSQAGRLF